MPSFLRKMNVSCYLRIYLTILIFLDLFRYNEGQNRFLTPSFTLDSCVELTTLALIFGDLLFTVTLYCGLFNTFDAGFVGFKSSSVFPDAYKDAHYNQKLQYFFQDNYLKSTRYLLVKDSSIMVNHRMVQKREPKFADVLVLNRLF